MRSTLTPAPLLTLLALAPAVVLAHHGWSWLRLQQVLTFTGTIREAGYEHPHGFVKLETPGKIWLAVVAPPSRMENRGDEGRHLHEAEESHSG
jgi:hypothetical protein